MKMKLLSKFVVSLVTLGIVLSIAISLSGYSSFKVYLEDMYADRVVTNSKTIASMLSAEDVRTIIGPNGDQSEAYRRTYDLLNQLKLDGRVTFLSLVVPDEDSVTFYIDCFVPELGDDPKNQLPYGTDIPYTDHYVDGQQDVDPYLHIWDLYQQNLGSSEPIITDNNYGYNYGSVAPVLDENGQAIAEVHYILDMMGVRARLHSVLFTMLSISAFIMAIAIFAYILLVRRTVTIPLGKLASFTNHITETGKFDEAQSIDLVTHDEIEELGNSFNSMLSSLQTYIADLSHVTAEKERIGAELDVAAHIQSSMLPCIFPAFPRRTEFDIYATMTPAKEVGGDFYDFFMIDERHLALVVADVSGKGVPAALFMVIGKTLLKDHTQPGTDLGAVFTEVNDLLCESNSEGLFITAFEAVLDLVTGELRYVNAGHETPFIARKGQPYEPYSIKPGFVLAGLEGMKYTSGVETLYPGDRLYQYTDGVTEATNLQEELFGMERLTQSLNRHRSAPPDQLLSLVKEDIDAFVGEAVQFDDITMLCLEYKEKMEWDRP